MCVLWAGGGDVVEGQVSETAWEKDLPAPLAAALYASEPARQSAAAVLEVVVL